MSCVSYLFIDLNSYFASVEQELHPILRSRPVAVIPTNSEHTCCIAASYEAKAYGVTTGTMVREAKRLCPNITFRLAKHGRYVDYHHKIMQAIESCHPIHKILSIDECILSLRGRDQNLTQAIQLADEIRNSIFHVGSQLQCSIGIACNQFLAKVASNLQKPNGLSVLTKKDVPQKLYSLQLRGFPGIGSAMLKRLQTYGIQNTRQLYSLDRHSMKQIWGGIMGERFYYCLHGHTVADLPKQQTKSIGHSHVLEPQYRCRDGSYKIAMRLLQKAAIRLRQVPAWTKTLKVSLRFTDNSKWTNEIHLHETQDSLSLIKALETMWLDCPHKKPKKVSIVLGNLVHPKQKNNSLLDNKSLEDLSHAIDKVNSKHGKNMIYFAASQEAQNAAHSRIAFNKIPDFDFEDT